MLETPIPIRKECPPGACVCQRERLTGADADLRILMLTREQEKKLIARIDTIASYAELQHLAQRLRDQLGVELQIAPGANEVRTVLGLQIQLIEQPGLCSKTRKTVAAAVRRCLDRHPQIIYAILDAHGLFGAR